jgi:putative transposase
VVFSVAFAAFVTDAYSRKIMGYSVGDKIDTSLALEALVMALNSRRFDTELMHHSDRDGRYCSADYIRLLRAYGIKISMTETSDPRDNAIAERLNGIIKQEFGLKRFSGSLEELTKLLDEAVYLYNTYRPHMSCNYKTPEETHSSCPVPTIMLPGNMTPSGMNLGTLV